MQGPHPCLYCVVDLHAMTMPHDPATLRRTTREVTAAFLACGIDPTRTRSSTRAASPSTPSSPGCFDCVARLGWLNRMTQFKEKAGKDRENASVGLYNYPVLMAADILLYRATHVPVGDDQKQHLELDARRRAEVQQRLRRFDRRARTTATRSSRCPSR